MTSFLDNFRAAESDSGIIFMIQGQGQPSRSSKVDKWVFRGKIKLYRMFLEHLVAASQVPRKSCGCTASTSNILWPHRKHLKHLVAAPHAIERVLIGNRLKKQYIFTGINVFITLCNPLWLKLSKNSNKYKNITR